MSARWHLVGVGLVGVMLAISRPAGAQADGPSIALIVKAGRPLRVALEAESTIPRKGVLPRLFRWLAAFLFSVLACWVSPASGPVLLGLGLLEAWRIRLIAPNSNPRLIGVKSVLPAIGAVLFELVLRNRYHPGRGEEAGFPGRGAGG